MKSVTKLALVLSALPLCALSAHAYGDVNDNVYGDSGSHSSNSSFDNIPSGAYVVLEGSCAYPGATASASAWGSCPFISLNYTYPQAGDVDGFTSYAGTVYYSIAATGTSYAFIEIDWF